MPEFDRPKSEHDFEVWAFERASHLCLAKKYAHREATGNTYADKQGKKYKDRDLDENWFMDQQEAKRVGLIDGAVYAAQFYHVLCRQLIDQVMRLPEEKRRFVLAYIDRGSITDYARETGVNLYEAMDAQKSAKEMMRRISDDMADERREASFELPLTHEEKKL